MQNLLSVQKFNKLVPEILRTRPDCAEDPGVQIINEYFTKYEDNGSVIGITEVLENFDQEREAGAFEPAEEELPDKVRVMTMHSAKGLEARVVFVPALEDDLIPGAVENLEERRRLFYVSVTRTREILFLSWAYQRTGQEIHRKGGKMIDKQRSRFLTDMGE